MWTILLLVLFSTGTLFTLWLFIAAKVAPRPVISPLRKKGPLVIAHGDNMGMGLYPGNTLLYLRKMVELGVDAVELDLNLTADGHLVLMHDNRVDRISDGTGAIIGMTLAELRRLNVAHNWSHDGKIYPYRTQPQRMVTIDEVFAELPQLSLIIEIKNNTLAAAQALCESIRKYNRQSGLIVSSFHQRVINEFRRICPEVTTGAATIDALLFYTAQLVHAERLLHPSYQTMQLPVRYFGIKVFSKRLIHAVHKLGLHVSVWTVNERADMQYYLDLGVDGIVTDRPDTLLSLLLTRR